MPFSARISDILSEIDSPDSVFRKGPHVPSASELTIKSATAISRGLLDDIVAMTVELTKIASPTNDEGDRAARVAEIMKTEGLDDVQVDHLHDVTGVIRGKTAKNPLLVASHTDTVFPRNVDLNVVRDGDKLHGPGVGDNTVSVACGLLLKRAFDAAGIVPDVDIIITGNVGEEGLGDLRGMRAVVDAHPEIGGAIAVEGHSLGRVTTGAVGSRRLKVTVTGPGGHSWGAAGLPSAIHHLARIVASLDDIELTQDPKTSFNAGLFEGGISVNTIAPLATAVLDMRSTSAEALARLVNDVETRIALPKPDGISVDVEVVGDRPAGQLPEDRGLIPIAIDVVKEMGLDPVTDVSSTDANIPISRGIPSMCIGLTTGANVHRVDEYINISPLVTGFAGLMVTVQRSCTAIASGRL